MISRSFASSAPMIICVLAGGSEPRSARRFPFLFFRFVEAQAKSAHRLTNDERVLLRRKTGERLVDRQFDIHRKPIRGPAGALHQILRRSSDRLEMDVSSEVVIAPQRLGDADHLLHRMVFRFRYPRRKKQSLDHVAAIKAERERYDLLDLEPRARRVARQAIDAKSAVVDAEIREEHLEERNASAVRCVGVTDARARRGSKPFAVARVSTARSGGRAGSVVFRGVRKDSQLPLKVCLDLNVHGLFLPQPRWPAKRTGPERHRAAVGTRLLASCRFPEL